MEYLYSKQVITIAVGLIISSIILFIIGFYSGSLMTAQVYQSAEHVSHVAKAEVDAELPNMITASEPPGAGVASIIKSANANEVQTNITPLEDSLTRDTVVRDAVVRDAIVKESAIRKRASLVDFDNETPKLSKSAQAQPTPTDTALANNANKSTNLYALQVGSFSLEANALGLSRVLSAKGYNPRIILSTPYQNKPDKQYKVMIGLFPTQEVAIEEAYRYTNKEKTPVYVIPSPVWRVNNKMNKTEVAQKGVYVDYRNLQQHKQL